MASNIEDETTTIFENSITTIVDFVETKTEIVVDVDANTSRATILGAGTCDTIRERGVSWPTTREGVVAERPCPLGIEGI